MDVKINRRGGCLMLAWGPPWVWVPSWERSRYHRGWSLTWLWVGLYYVPVSAGTLLLEGAFPRCGACAQFSRKLDDQRTCPDCRACSGKDLAQVPVLQ